MTFLYFLYWFIHIAVIFFLVFPFLTVVLSLFKKEKQVQSLKNEGDTPLEEHDFACVITAYKNIDIALPLVDSFLKQEHKNRVIYLVADGCDTAPFYTHFGDAIPPDVVLLKPEKDLNAKVKSIIHGVNNFVRDHEYILILDPDNLAKPDFLTIINQYIHAGFDAVQGKRTAKNLDTIYACGAATGELYKNYIERYVPYVLGSSATIAGSAMAVEASLYKAYLHSEEIRQCLDAGQVIVAEDKLLQNFLVTKGYRIAFAQDAIMYDEKVSEGEQVKRQRKRWLFSYFQNIPNSIKFLLQGALKLNVNQLLLGLAAIAPPLFILLFAALGLGLADLTLAITGWLPATWVLAMVAAVFTFIANIFFVLYLAKAPQKVWASLWGIPFFIGQQVLALLKMGKARKDFLVTTHTKKVSLEEVMKGE